MIQKISEITIPLIFAITAVFALYHRVDVYSSLISGAEDGIKTIFKICPSLIALLSAIYMFRASGAADALIEVLTPLLTKLGIPSETASIMLIRPLSGSGALAIGTEIMQKFGPDSQIGRTASVMLGSTETTFYVLAIYFGSSDIKPSRYTVISALLADMASFIVSSIVVRLMFS